MEKDEKVMGQTATQPVKPEETQDPRKEADRLLKEAGKILTQFGGQASNIPISSGYWEMMNQYRSLMASIPRPENAVTEPYRELSAKALDKPYRPEQIKTDVREAMAHYDRQHPAAAAVIQMEIQKENETRMTPEDKAERDKEQKESEKRLEASAREQEEINKRRIEEEKRRLEEKMKQLNAEAKK